MKFLRLRISSSILETVGLDKMLNYFTKIEIIQAYQYDNKHFFTMQKLTYKPDALGEKDLIFKKILGVTSATEVEKTGNEKNGYEITYIMTQKRNKGFWPLLDNAGTWALIPPVIVDQHSILMTTIADEINIGMIHKYLASLNIEYEILAQATMDDSISAITMPYPKFKKRQSEIAHYAAIRGYFEIPKGISAKDIANHFNISVSAVNENLRKAQNLSMQYFFGKRVNEFKKELKKDL